MIFPQSPDIHGIAVLILIAIALVIFTWDKISLETSSLVVMTLLLVGFEFFPYSVMGEKIHPTDFFKGFGHEALIAVCALMIVGQGLVRTGALEPFGRGLAGLWMISPSLSLLLTLFISGLLSAFVNNVPIVVLLLPILVSVAHRTGKPATGMLMPMGFATIIGGMSTTIGTSTNLLVVSVSKDLGVANFSMFDFFIPAAIAGSVALVFLWLIAPRMLPEREMPLGNFSPRVFAGHLHVEEDSYANEITLAKAIEKTGGKLNVTQIFRDKDKKIAPLPDMLLRSGDRIGVRDTPDNLKEFEELLGAKLYNEDDALLDETVELSAKGQQIAEIVITRGSPLAGMTLSKLHFAEIHQLVILALHRVGSAKKRISQNVEDIQLRTGDVLLVQGDEERIIEMKRERDVFVLDATSDLPRTNKSSIALAIVTGVVVSAAFGLLPIAISAVCGVLLMITTNCLSWRDAAQSLSTQVILIVAASLALGSALVKTGGADYLAHVFLAITSGASPSIILSGLMLVMAILTNIVSNNAAAVIGTPIAVNIATQLGLPPEAFVLAVLFGANMCYATPMAYKTNLLVMNAGGYRFLDFVKVGIPLIIIIWGVLSLLLPRMYGF